MAPGVAFAASAVVPGAGQFLLHADRWVPFAAVEAWGWFSYFDRRGNGRSLARDFRDLAWSVARRVSVGGRRDSIFEYYEAMSHFASSGALDGDPRTSGVQPELDSTTFNGELWVLAKALYFPGGIDMPPGTQAYERALQYYLGRAIPASFAWAWGDSNLEQQTFRELIRRSDESLRSSTQILGLLLANHMVSAINALVAGRLQAKNAPVRLRVGSSFEAGDPQGRWILQARVIW